MGTCRDTRRWIDGRPDSPDPPASVAAHCADCADCASTLATARLAHRLVQLSATPLEPPEQFAAQVCGALSALPDRRAEFFDLWRPAWGLVPTFAAILAALLLWQPSLELEPSGLLDAGSFTADERLILEPGELSLESILQTVLGGNGR